MKNDHRSKFSNLSNWLLLSNCLNWKIYCDDHSSLHLQPQYKYELFHIYFTSLHCTGKYELNKLTWLPMCGFIAQLVEHRTGIAEVTGSNPVEALIFFRLLLSNCLNWKIYCDDHSSLLLPRLFPSLQESPFFFYFLQYILGLLFVTLLP